MESNIIRNSKTLAFILRHHPEKYNITLDKNGWANLNELWHNTRITLGDIKDILELEGKPRFELSANNDKVRAFNGHSNSLNVDTQLEKLIPPPFLFHGTKEEFLPQIQKLGLLPMSRIHVHLSSDKKIAQESANRKKGNSIILTIDSMSMAANNHKFYKSTQNIWLSYHIPPQFIKTSL